MATSLNPLCYTAAPETAYMRHSYESYGAKAKGAPFGTQIALLDRALSGYSPTSIVISVSALNSSIEIFAEIMRRGDIDPRILITSTGLYDASRTCSLLDRVHALPSITRHEEARRVLITFSSDPSKPIVEETSSTITDTIRFIGLRNIALVHLTLGVGYYARRPAVVLYSLVTLAKQNGTYREEDFFPKNPTVGSKRRHPERAEHLRDGKR